MTKWIIFILLALIALALIAYGSNWIGDQVKKGELVKEQEKIGEVLATGLSQTDSNLIDAWKKIAENAKEIERLKQGRAGLEKEKIAIVVPATVSDLVAAFNKRGLRARARNMLPVR
jgi:hypothetical protein